MMYTITREAFGRYDSYWLTTADNKQRAQLIPEFGGIINRWQVRHQGQWLNLIDGYATDNEMINIWNGCYKSAKLLPYPNRIAAGQYEFNGQSYQLAVDFPAENNAIHGLLSTASFDVIEQYNSENEAVVGLFFHYKANRSGYPFHFTTHLLYRLNQDGLSISTRIINTDDVEIPIGDGWHHYFCIGDKTIDDLELQFSVQNILNNNEQQIPTGDLKQYSDFEEKRQIADYQLDDCFSLAKEQTALGQLTDPALGLSIELSQPANNTAYRFLQVYTPPHRQSVAIEPMTCWPDMLNNAKGMIRLAPGKHLELDFTMSINSK